jgi:hypothetical protein
LFGNSIDVIGAGVQARIIAFSVDGVLLSFNEYAAPDQFDQLDRQVQQILESLTFP